MPLRCRVVLRCPTGLRRGPLSSSNSAPCPRCSGGKQPKSPLWEPPRRCGTHGRLAGRTESRCEPGDGLAARQQQPVRDQRSTLSLQKSKLNLLFLKKTVDSDLGESICRFYFKPRERISRETQTPGLYLQYVTEPSSHLKIQKYELLFESKVRTLPSLVRSHHLSQRAQGSFTRNLTLLVVSSTCTFL